MRQPRKPSTGLPTLREAAANASTGGASDAAHLALSAGGSAVDAVVAGFFAAAGTHPGVLLGPTAAIVGNAGSGVRAFDGRSLQPGKGAPRPRGFVEGQAIPDAARVAVPRSVPMLFLLHAYGGRTSISTLAKYGAEAATALDAKQRAKVIRRVGAAGVIGLRTEGVHEALLNAANSVAGGCLTEADLDEVMPADADGRALFRADEAIVTGCPFPGDEPTDGDTAWTVDTIVAADFWGGVAAFSYAYQPEAVLLPSVELAVPRLAIPIRRGVPRVTPGTVLRAPSPIGIARFGRDLSLAFGLAGAWRRAEPALFDALDVEALSALSSGAAVEGALATMARTNKASRCLAAIKAPRATRPVTVVASAEG